MQELITAWESDPKRCLIENRNNVILLFLVKLGTSEDEYTKLLTNLGFSTVLELAELSINYGVDPEMEINLFAEQLKKDRNSKRISTCARWAPLESTKYDKPPLKIATRIRKKMKIKPKTYRTIIKTLREHIETRGLKDRLGRIPDFDGSLGDIDLEKFELALSLKK